MRWKEITNDLSSYERFFTALQREKPDRVPISLWTHAYNRFAGMSFKEFARDGKKMAEAHLTFLDKFKVDFLKVTPCGLFFAEDWGGKLEYFEEKASLRCTEYPVKTTEDWEKLPVLDPRKAKLHAEQLKCLKIINSKIGGKIPFIETVFNSLTVATKIAGERRVFSDMKENPKTLKKGLEAITKTSVDFIRACLDEGVTGIFLSIKASSTDVITSDEFDQFNTPYDMELLDAMKDAEVIILHMHSEKPGAKLMMDKMQKYPVHALNWWDKGTTLTLQKAKASLSGKFCLVAGIDFNTLLREPEQIEQEVKHAIETAAPNGGFMLGPGCVMNAATPERNIKAAINAAMKYGSAKSLR